MVIKVKSISDIGKIVSNNNKYFITIFDMYIYVKDSTTREAFLCIDANTEIAIINNVLKMFDFPTIQIIDDSALEEQIKKLIEDNKKKEEKIIRLKGYIDYLEKNGYNYNKTIRSSAINKYSKNIYGDLV